MFGTLNAIYNAFDKGNVVVMVCLNSSATLNIIYPTRLPESVSGEFGVKSDVFISYYHAS